MLTRFLAAAIFSWRAFSSASAMMNNFERVGAALMVIER
jgi:hypothetical protein